MFRVFMNIAQSIIQSFLSFSSDAIIIAGIAILFTAYAMFFGKGKIVSLILGFYPSVYLFKNVPYVKKLVSTTPITISDALTQLVLFLILFIPISFVISKYIYAEFSFSRVKKVVSSTIFGGAATVLTLVFLYHVVNIQKIYNFSTGIDSLFIGNHLFWWLLAPFAIIFIFRR